MKGWVEALFLFGWLVFGLVLFAFFDPFWVALSFAAVAAPLLIWIWGEEARPGGEAGDHSAGTALT